MNIHESVAALAAYAVEKNLVEQADRVWAVNSLCQALGLDSWEEPETVPAAPLEDILKDILDWAEARGLIDGGVTSRDLLDTKLMGILTPRPSEVMGEFDWLYWEAGVVLLPT